MVIATMETAKPQKPELKPTAAPKRASVKSKGNAAASVKTAAATPTTPSLVVPTQGPTHPIEDILDHLPLHACGELTCRLLTSTSSLPTWGARPCAVLKTVILFVAE